MLDIIMEQIPLYIQNYDLLKFLEEQYGNVTLKSGKGLLRFGKISPQAEDTIETLQNKSYYKILARYTDALLFLEILTTKKIYSQDTIKKVQEKGRICDLAKKIRSICESILPNGSFPFRHEKIICVTDPENKTEVFTGVALSILGILTFSLGLQKIFN